MFCLHIPSFLILLKVLMSNLWILGRKYNLPTLGCFVSQRNEYVILSIFLQ